MGSLSHDPARGRAIKPIHKRSASWNGYAFGTPGEVVDFASELVDLLQDAGTEPELKVNLTTEDREYRGLTLDELQELSPTLLMKAIKTLRALSATGEQSVAASLLLHGNDSTCWTQLDVEGSNQVVVDGVNVWATKQIASRIERLEKAQRLAEAESKLQKLPWKRWLSHPWAIQVVGGAAAAVLAAGVFLLLSH